MATVKEAAHQHGKSESTIRRLARQHRLPAKKVGRRWDIGDVGAMHTKERAARANKEYATKHPERVSGLPAGASKAAHRQYAGVSKKKPKKFKTSYGTAGGGRRFY